MLLIDYNSPKSLTVFLESRGLAMCKRFGQNFLINESTRNRLIDALSPAGDQKVWEIGPGLGAMTSILLDRKIKTTVFEIDKGFIAALNTLFESDLKNGSLNIVGGDALKTLPALYKKMTANDDNFSPLLFGNLPYNIGATLIATLFESEIRFPRAVFTLQKEVASRLIAKPSTADYSSFTVLASTYCNIKIICDLAAVLFYPAPRVTSAAVLFTQKAATPALDAKSYSRFIRSAFTSRRKTLLNNLKAAGYDTTKILTAISAIKKSVSIRAESLTSDDFITLYFLLNKPSP